VCPVLEQDGDRSGDQRMIEFHEGHGQGAGNLAGK
jgi:hypothetical protein